jgi:hypothetical protein
MPAPKGNTFAKGNKGGRPTKYSDDFIEKTYEYIESCKDSCDENGKLLKVSLPTIAGLSLFLNVGKRSLYEWSAENKEFSHALEAVQKEQENRLVMSGLAGTYNPTIAKLMLSAKHEYRETTDITSKGNELLNNLTVKFINAKGNGN